MHLSAATGKSLLILSIGLFLNLFSKPANGQVVRDTTEHPSLAFASGIFDIKHPQDISGLLEIDYYSRKSLWIFSLFGGGLFTPRTDYYFYGGVYLPLNISKRYFFRLSFAGGIYSKGDSKTSDYPLEFRSSIEFGYRFRNDGKIALGFTHISNAGLSYPNPGLETLVIYYEIPLVVTPR